MKKLSTIVNVFGIVLLLSGIGLYYAISRSMRSDVIAMPAAQAATTESVPAKVSVPAPADSGASQPKPAARVDGQPVKIVIPALDLSLQIVPGYYNQHSKTWTLSNDKAQFATLSTLPNSQSGNTFVYGHARKNVFASLHSLPAGAVAVVTTDNGHTFYYELSATQVVDPSDWDAVFGYQGKPILTLQTCTGPTYAKRQLFTFNLVRVA